VAAFNAGDYKKALLKAQEMIQHNIANGDGHFMAMVALKHLGKQEEADREKLTVDKIVQSIMGAGDGKTAGAAWFTVTTSEDVFCHPPPRPEAKISGFGNRGNPLVRQMTVIGDDGKEATLWFNTDTDIEMTRKALTDH
jgi:hypothetical protein